MAEKKAIERPQRWDVPFDPNMTEEMVDEILAIDPFCNIDQDKFPKSIPLRGIILNEARVLKYKKGDIIVRKGDYGNSAFFTIKGSARVVIPLPNNALPEKTLGRQTPKKRSLWESVSQVWKNPKGVEYRAKVQGSKSDQAGSSHSGQVEAGDGAGVRMVGDQPQIFLQDVPGVISNLETVSLPEGQFFGEIAALGRTPRTATIFADDDDTVLLEIKWQGLRDLRKYTPSIKESIDKRYRENSLKVELGAAPMLSHLDKETIEIIADSTQFKSVGGFDWYASYKKVAQKSSAERLDNEPVIYEEGAYPESLVIIRAGFARVSQVNGNGHRTISYLGKGQTFGFREIAHNWRSEEPVTYQNSMRGLGYVDILVIPSHIVEKYVLPSLDESELPPMIEVATEAAPTYNAVPVENRPKKDRLSRTDVMEFLVEHRYINGTATMLVNLDRCTRCDDCVNACASAHDNNPRFVREGRNLGSLMVAHSCMHCNDPVCMIGCPTGAISRQTGGGQVTINDTTCIGCATCANSCPYENIRMVEVRDGQGEFIRDDDTMKPIVKATKCDLCAEQIGGPSCQNACPHDALVRMDMQNPENLMKWIGR